MTTTAKRLLLVFLLLLPCAPARAGADKFWVWDLTVMPPAFRQPTFTKVGEAPLAGNEKVSVWVEDGLGAHAPTPEQLGALVPLYARAIDLERGTFGAQPTPPSRDRDFHVLIAAIPPYESHGRKFGFDGFFNAFDQLSEKDAREQGQHSNERNIIYVNALQDVNGDYMRAVVVHELNHLITHGQYDGEKNALDPWVNEMLGESAMQLAGYFTDVKHVQAYRAHPEW
ncbi:MAG: hypothetical protein HY075_11375, partial [Deltaproteobacteria bacterium]|nr:hypothetical protein [Deltaproteobacteria bacterium]